MCIGLLNHEFFGMFCSKVLLGSYEYDERLKKSTSLMYEVLVVL